MTFHDAAKTQSWPQNKLATTDAEPNLDFCRSQPLQQAIKEGSAQPLSLALLSAPSIFRDGVMMTKTVLVLVESVNEYLPILEDSGFRLILAPTPATRAEAVATRGNEIDAVLTRGPLGFTADEIAALPKLGIICVIGAGYEQVDLLAARGHCHQRRRGQCPERGRPCDGVITLGGA